MFSIKKCVFYIIYIKCYKNTEVELILFYKMNYIVLNLDLNKAIKEIDDILEKEGLSHGRC